MNYSEANYYKLGELSEQIKMNYSVANDSGQAVLRYRLTAKAVKVTAISERENSSVLISLIVEPLSITILFILIR